MSDTMIIVGICCGQNVSIEGPTFEVDPVDLRCGPLVCMWFIPGMYLVERDPPSAAYTRGP